MGRHPRLSEMNTSVKMRLVYRTTSRHLILVKDSAVNNGKTLRKEDDELTHICLVAERRWSEGFFPSNPQSDVPIYPSPEDICSTSRN